MLKTFKIKKTVDRFKYGITKDIDVKSRITGSFGNDNRKWVTDVDMMFSFSDGPLSKHYSEIRKIIRNIRDYKEVSYLNFYLGHEDYYYRQKYSLGYFRKLRDEGLIDDKMYGKLENLMDRGVETESLRRLTKKFLGKSWSYTKVMKDTEEFKKYLDKDNMFFVDILLHYESKYIPIEIVINTKMEKKKSVDTLIKNCMIAMHRYYIEDYYYFLKRLASCYMMKKNNKYAIRTAKEIRKIIISKDKLLSTIRQKWARVKMGEEEQDDEDEEETMRKMFQHYAQEYYEEGVKRGLLPT